MGVLNAMIQFFTGHRNRLDAEQEEVSRAIAYQAAKGEVLRGQLKSEIKDLRGAEVRMHEYFGDLQIAAGRKRRGST